MTVFGANQDLKHLLECFWVVVFDHQNVDGSQYLLLAHFQIDVEDSITVPVIVEHLMVCEYEAVLALFVHVQFAHFCPAQVVLVVVNDAEIALCRAVSLLCKLLFDYELAL